MIKLIRYNSIQRNEFFEIVFLLALIFILGCSNHTSNPNYPQHIFQHTENLEPRWFSFENMTGEKGKGGMENNGAKGHAFDMIESGESKTLVDIEGPGIINRIWITIRNRSERDLRGLVINVYWDNEEKPAVSVPFGDFFGVGLGKTAVFENAFFANPEGRSFNSFVQMAFKKAAKIEILNELDYPLTMIFFDVDLQKMKEWDESFLYFHGYWHRDTATTLTEDFEILPKVNGKGRFLGSNISVVANRKYGRSWWGEGEFKAYLDGDKKYPTLIGTGTEDFIGTAWGQGQFANKYTGCLIADTLNRQWSYYRYHLIDPIYFSEDCKVTMQQMGGAQMQKIIGYQKNGAQLIPVDVLGELPELRRIYKRDSIFDLESPDLTGKNWWVNFYRSDDYSATAYFYLDKPVNNLPAIQNLEIRTYNLK